MSPEVIIAAVSLSCGVLLVVGSLVLGRAMADRDFRSKRVEMRASVASLRERLQEALAKADAARAESESLRLESEQKVSQVGGEQAAGADDKALEQFQTKIAELQAKLHKAESAADEADKEFSIVRDKLDKTEKRLAETNRLLASDDEPKSLPADAEATENIAARESELEAARRAADKLSTVEKERDQALRRIRELDKKPTESARIRALEERLRATEDEKQTLESEVRKRDEKVASSGGSVTDAEELGKLRAELTTANERLAVSERVMEGVRARSSMLSDEVKRLKAELAQHG